MGARCTGFDAISLPRRKEMAKEKTPRRSLLELPGIPPFYDKRRGFAFAKFLHLRGIYPTPQMGLQAARFFCYPVGVGGRSKSAERIYAERLGFPKTSIASFWGSQQSEESAFGDPLVRRFAFVAGGARFFALCVAIRSYCATVSCAERIAFFMLLLGVSQEVAKKETWTFPPRPPLVADAGLPRRGVCVGKRLARIFAFCFYVRSYCASATRAEREAFYATSWRFPRSSQERNQGFPPWNPLSPAVLP